MDCKGFVMHFLHALTAFLNIIDRNIIDTQAKQGLA